MRMSEKQIKEAIKREERRQAKLNLEDNKVKITQKDHDRKVHFCTPCWK